MSPDTDSAESETITVFESDGKIVARDETTGVSSFGESKPEAIERLAEALKLYAEPAPEDDEDEMLPDEAAVLPDRGESLDDADDDELLTIEEAAERLGDRAVDEPLTTEEAEEAKDAVEDLRGRGRDRLDAARRAFEAEDTDE